MEPPIDSLKALIRSSVDRAFESAVQGAFEAALYDDTPFKPTIDKSLQLRQAMLDAYSIKPLN